ncbi:hypothetical protein HID58_069624 [Brassica napus]|uniref:Uncharacterized protein n=1 Tax=Brassica napus TaxID=3708 RepID=A0ABQ7YWF6_BRANA|nr:hypothetical protein HID58_069624 [Brassica napus]
MFLRSRLSREEKGKGVADSPSPTRDEQVADSPLDNFDLIHRDALRDSDNMTLSQRLLVADAHKMIREERAGRIEVGNSEGGVRDPNTIAYPENFFESSQAIAAHSHLPDWESKLPVVLGPRKSRLSLFTRKQHKILDEARKMDGVPDLSALLRGKLQLLSKKSTTTDMRGATSSDAGRASSEGTLGWVDKDLGSVDKDVGAEPPASSLKKKATTTDMQGATSSNAGRASLEGTLGLVDKDVEAEPPASSPKKRKRSKKARRKAAEELPLEEMASLDETSEGLEERKRERGRKRPFEAGSVEADRSEVAPEDRPRKKKKKKSVETEPRPSDAEVGLVEVVAGGDVSLETPSAEREVSARGGDPVADDRPIPDPSARARSRSEGSTVRGKKIEFPDRVEFSYNETTPLILNPLRCAELTRQICGGTKEMPQLDDLYFRNEYIDAASSRARSDGSMNFLVEKYDSALKQTMIQLGSSEKLAQTRLKVIERVRAEHKKANEKAVEEKEILRVKFEELEGKLKGRERDREGGCRGSCARLGEGENDGIEEASLPRPAEEETTYEAGDIDVSSRPVIDSTVSIPTRAEDQTVAVAEDRGDQDSVL